MVTAWRPLTLKEALDIRASRRTLVLAGGTDVMVRQAPLSDDSLQVLCISHLEELRQINLTGDELRIGAACTLSQLLNSPLLPDYLKLPLAQMASPAIRNAATIGGNLCNASPAADALPMLYALDALLCLRSQGDEALMPVQDFFLGPGKTRLGESQLLTDIRIPLRRGWRCQYRKVAARKANCLSKLSFYALSDRGQGHLRDIRIAFGAVAPTVVRCREAELAIQSAASSPGAECLEEIIARYDLLIQPIDDVRSSRVYRRNVSLRLLEEYLRKEMSL